MPEQIDFVVNGVAVSLSGTAVRRRMAGVTPEPIRNHAVLVDGTRFPVKQVFALATGLDRLDFTSATARRNLAKLGFELTRASS